LVVGYEVWKEVVVTSTGSLEVKNGGTLVTERVVLEGNSMFQVNGGTLELSPKGHRREAGISGVCSWFDVADNSVVRIRGPDGGYDVPTSMGCSVGINITASRFIQITDSTLDIQAGNGLSPPEPLTDGDLDGRAFAGGDAELVLVQLSPIDILWISKTQIRLRAGDGGSAPDAETPPPDPEGRLKGLGGGFTRGGDVGDRVGAGGDVRIKLSAARIEVSNTAFNVSAGKGGDAGDGASVAAGTKAGAGGGGYTGSDGASGLNEVVVAMPGGDVSGDVGRGGDIDLLVKAGDVDLRTALFDLRAGDGGKAGNGGSTDGLGGGGGGGYTGGGGGSYWYMAGARGGSVTDDVGRGGRVTADVTGSSNMEVKSARFWLLGGRGGDAGNGGDGGFFPGGGGGGYTGGGGGGGGEAEGTAAGMDGGDGGPVMGTTGLGGSASLRVTSERLICLSSWFDVEGGMGGMCGLPGQTHMTTDGDRAGGGGGGGHSAGGGAGAGGEGGDAGEVSGKVCDGGDGSLDIQSERPSIHRNTYVDTKWGHRGSVVKTMGEGTTRGIGYARDSYDGTMYEHIPMSQPMLWAPANEEYISIPPRFDWMPVFRSTTHGDVDHYLFKLDNNGLFDDPVLVTRLDVPGYYDRELPMATYYWKAIAVYHGPPGTEGPTPPFHWFRYFNAPPVVIMEPDIKVDEGVTKSVYIGNFVKDGDTGLQNLCMTCEHHGIQSIMGLFMTLFYAEYEPNHTIEYQVSDGTSNVTGILNIVVIDANERPVIVDVGGYKAPIAINMSEDTDLFLEVNAYDPNGDPLTYSVLGTWEGANMSKLGTLRLTATGDDIGMHVVSVVVDDGMGGVESERVRVLVRNLNEPPLAPEIFGPKNNSRWKEGEDIAFTVKVFDPDIIHGQVLQVTWASDISGELATMGTTEMATFTTDKLAPGNHRIHITVSDGEFTSHSYIYLTLVEREGPGPPPDPSNLWLYILFLVIFLMMIAVGYMAGTRGGDDDEGT
jgi:hypothetical protein